MWKQEILDRSEEVARSFNNEKVFETVREQDPEKPPGNFINYRPVREYCQTRHLRAIEYFGAELIPNLLNPTSSRHHHHALLGITFTRETRGLALIIGIRETGMPLFGRRRPVQPSLQFEMGGRRYIRNYQGSGLDILGSSAIRRRMEEYVGPGALRRMIIDAPTRDGDDVGILQSEIRSVFNIYLRQQVDTLLADMNLDSMDRSVRLFWRALTFGGQGGSPWEGSRSGGRQSLLSLCQLMRIGPSSVRELWNRAEVHRLLQCIDDVATLKKLSRYPTRATREYERRVRRGEIQSDQVLVGWRRLASDEIDKGLGRPRYFQAIKAAAITVGTLQCASWPLSWPTEP